MLEFKPINDDMKSKASDKNRKSVLDIAEECSNEYVDDINRNLLNSFESMVKNNKSNRSKFIELTNNVLDLGELEKLNEKNRRVPEQILKKALDYVVDAYVITDKEFHNRQNILQCLNEIKKEIDKYEEKIKA